MAAFRTLVEAGDSSNRVDIVVLGDGYTSWELQITYTSDISDLLGYLFDGSLLTQPFGRYQNFFNVHAIDVASAQSGADDPSLGVDRNTALNASYWFDGETDRLLYVDEQRAFEVQSEALAGTGIAPEMRFVLVNDATYGGGGGYYGVYAAGNAAAREIAVHEIGHAFAGLADEYEYGAARTHYTGPEPFEPNVTTDPTGSKWAHWLGYDQPGIGVIGAYPGGFYHETGVYRPSENSKMRSLGRPFDAVSREQFILQFYALVDPLDGHTDNATVQHDVASLSVEVIDPAVIQVDWSIAGRTFRDAGETLSLTFDHFAFGTYSVTARAYDDTDWVRGDRSTLEETVSWTLVNQKYLIGGPRGDRLRGNALANEIEGRGGDDAIFAGGGADFILAGAGDDRLVGGPGSDRLRGERGVDTVDFAADPGARTVRVSLAAGTATIATDPGAVDRLAGIENVVGTAGSDRIAGSAGANRLKGLAGNDRISGLGGNDLLDGGAGRDMLAGGGGTDTLRGGPARDDLSGGGGRDRFVVDGGPSADLIRDFLRRDDTILLDNRALKWVGSEGRLAADAFHLGREASDAEDRVVYDRGRGLLFYDPDGAGGAGQIRIAALTNKAALGVDDLWVI
jgi:hypothetical protein